VNTIELMPAALAKFIATRDKRAEKLRPWSRTPLSDYFRELVEKGVVRVGGRATCGSRVDPTWVEFGFWKEIVSKARALGYAIEEAPIKHGNGWATKAGGFWDESEYRLESRP
jgi:hypothetical protein